MKKIIALMICLMLILTGCSKAKQDEKSNEETTAEGWTSEAAPVEENLSVQEESSESSVTPDSVAIGGASSEGVDIDLTHMSSTMVYAEVYNIVMSPWDYIGKIVKMNGSYFSSYDEATGYLSCACIIQDATACCAQGIAFQLTDDYIYPIDFPEEEAEITVVGEFQVVQDDNGIQYALLVNAELI